RPGGALSETEAIGLQGLAADEMAGEAERAIGIVCRVGVCFSRTSSIPAAPTNFSYSRQLAARVALVAIPIQQLRSHSHQRAGGRSLDARRCAAPARERGSARRASPIRLTCTLRRTTGARPRSRRPPG